VSWPVIVCCMICATRYVASLFILINLWRPVGRAPVDHHCALTSCRSGTGWSSLCSGGPMVGGWPCLLGHKVCVRRTWLIMGPSRSSKHLASCSMMGGKWYMFRCVADFFVRPHWHMVGIVLPQPLISVDPYNCHLTFQVVCSGSRCAALIQSYAFDIL